MSIEVSSLALLTLQPLNSLSCGTSIVHWDKQARAEEKTQEVEESVISKQ